MCLSTILIFFSNKESKWNKNPVRKRSFSLQFHQQTRPSFRTQMLLLLTFSIRLEGLQCLQKRHSFRLSSEAFINGVGFELMEKRGKRWMELREGSASLRAYWTFIWIWKRWQPHASSLSFLIINAVHNLGRSSIQAHVFPPNETGAEGGTEMALCCDTQSSGVS